MVKYLKENHKKTNTSQQQQLQARNKNIIAKSICCEKQTNKQESKNKQTVILLHRCLESLPLLYSVIPQYQHSAEGWHATICIFSIQV
jgi:hypothetical protein